MDNEIAALIKEMEKEEELDAIVAEVTAPFDNDAEEIIEIVVPEVELMEDDVLVEDKPAVEVRTYAIGDAVILASNAVSISGSNIPDKYKGVKVYVRTIRAGGYGFSTSKTGRTCGFLVNPEYLTPYTENAIAVNTFKSYLILVKTDELDIKSRPIATSKTLKTIHRDGLFTVVDEKDNWGHLKIGGWIPLDQVRKIGV